MIFYKGRFANEDMQELEEYAYDIYLEYVYLPTRLNLQLSLNVNAQIQRFTPKLFYIHPGDTGRSREPIRLSPMCVISAWSPSSAW